jgi:riboflavin synthase
VYLWVAKIKRNPQIGNRIRKKSDFYSMFTGIIETMGEIRSISSSGTNTSFWIASSLSAELRPDQSVAHDGICLTVEDSKDGMHQVTAIQETLKKTNIQEWSVGKMVNIERAMLPSSRLDGHIVQGHVDAVAVCSERMDSNGSWEYRLSFPKQFSKMIVEKGSVCLNGISLTAFSVKNKSFRVAIIPYTFEHTNMKDLNPGMRLNIEFDLIGKYVNRIMSQSTKHDSY